MNVLIFLSLGILIIEMHFCIQIYIMKLNINNVINNVYYKKDFSYLIFMHAFKLKQVV